MIFLDTSVLIAAAQTFHPHHQPSRDLVSTLRLGSVVISAHTIAEVYSALTRMPPRTPPAIAMQAVETYLLKMKPVTLTIEEYLSTVRETAQNGHAGGMIYDALLLSCARKSNAKQIYTWNLKHFRILAPDLADIIVTP
jgi:predicted nucleic acid-binding protein